MTNVHVTVTVHEPEPVQPPCAVPARRLVTAALTVLITAYLMGWLGWLVAAAAIAAALWFAIRIHRDWLAAEHAERRRRAAIAARADQQHAWTLAGDPRGTYGTKGTESQL